MGIKTDKKENGKEIGIRIKKIRDELNITQEKLAEQIGVSTMFVSMMERGVKRPSLETVQRLAEISGYTIDEILYGGASIEMLNQDTYNYMARNYAPGDVAEALRFAKIYLEIKD